MKTAMEIARAQIQQLGKGEDAYLIRRLDSKGMAQLIAVADGLSLGGGKPAARWAINHLRKATDIESPRSIYRSLRHALEDSQQVEQSETTLTCGILRQMDDGNEPLLRFEYFAIGDSPIWKVIPGDSKYPFQRMLIHGPLYPAETARVYSTLRLHKKDITGSIMFGATELALGEVLVVCTDGIPEREVFIRDFVGAPDDNSAKDSLCRWLFQDRKYSDSKLKRVLRGYNERGVLFDDATIIAARLGPAPIVSKQAIAEPQLTSGTLDVDDSPAAHDQLSHVLSESSPLEDTQDLGNAVAPPNSDSRLDTLANDTTVPVEVEPESSAARGRTFDQTTE